MTAKVYAEALYRALENGMDPKKAFGRLAEVLKEHGRETLLRQSLMETQILLEGAARKNTAAVVVARKEDAKKYKADIETFLKEYGGENTEILVDEHIVGGYVVRNATHETDASYKKSLLSIYQSLTTK